MSPRGGPRKGAGRKPRKTPLVAITLRIDKGLLEAFNKEKKRQNLSGPKLLAKFLGWIQPVTGRKTKTSRPRKPAKVSDRD